jgi:excisionase family DNA binding protein
MANAEVTDGGPSRLYFTIAEVAELFNISTKTVRRLIARGELRAVRIGGKHLIPATEVARLQESVEAGHGADWARA